MININFQKRKQAFEQRIDDTLNVFLARQNGDPEYLDDDETQEAHEKAWNLLTEEQRQQIWGLSADLHSLDDNEKPSNQSDQPDRETLGKTIAHSYEKGDWQTLLSSFRFDPAFVEKEKIAYMRGRAWQKLGFPRVAIAFYDNASRLEPTKTTYRYLAMNQVEQLGDWEDLT